jgi:hypothetical protein
MRKHLGEYLTEAKTEHAGLCEIRALGADFKQCKQSVIRRLLARRRNHSLATIMDVPTVQILHVLRENVLIRTIN